MGNIPPQLLAGLSPSETDTAIAWWAGLPECDRADLIALCVPDEEAAGGPKIIGGCFVPDDKAAGWSEWFDAYFEHLVALPDPVFYEPPFFRTFHIG